MSELTPKPVTTWLSLVAWLALCMAAGAVGAVASANARDFYTELSRPAWAPPGWIFGPMWTTLYVLMGISAWLVWRERHQASARTGLWLFVIQLAVNSLWTWLFFAWRTGVGALAGIIVLALLIIATMAAFARVKRVAAVLLVPYLIWVLFATALTVSVWRLNPGLL